MPTSAGDYGRTRENIMRTIRIIPSKSDAHRALICAALTEKSCEVICDQTSEDIEATKKCLEALSLGRSEMYCGESGSTFRFLLPIMGALGHKADFYLEGRLPERPLTPLYEELLGHGCRLSPQGSVPFTIDGQLKSGEYLIPGNVSSQYISGLMFALPLLEGDSRIFVSGKLESRGYVDLTMDMLDKFGVKIEETDDGFFVKGAQRYLGPKKYTVEGDWSNGTFWLVAGALLEEGICIRGLSMDSLQGDKKILDILRKFGAEVEAGDTEIKVSKKPLTGFTIDASLIPDMVPALAVLASTAFDTTTIEKAGRLRIKESDRLATITQVLKTLGADIEELPEGLVIHPSKLTGGEVDSHGDHRIAMMAAIASLICDNPVVLTGSEAVNKSYPGFFEDMKKLGLDKNLERK